MSCVQKDSGLYKGKDLDFVAMNNCTSINYKNTIGYIIKLSTQDVLLSTDSHIILTVLKSHHRMEQIKIITMGNHKWEFIKVRKCTTEMRGHFYCPTLDVPSQRSVQAVGDIKWNTGDLAHLTPVSMRNHRLHDLSNQVRPSESDSLNPKSPVFTAK